MRGRTRPEPSGGCARSVRHSGVVRERARLLAPLASCSTIDLTNQPRRARRAAACDSRSPTRRSILGR